MAGPFIAPSAGYAPGGVTYRPPPRRKVTKQPQSAAQLPMGYAQVSSEDPSMTVLARLSEDRPTVDQGFGGWDEVERPRRSPLTTWKGSPALHIGLPLLLDGFAAGESVEHDLGLLLAMGQPTAKNNEPPHLTVQARGAGLPLQGHTWVLRDMTFGDGEVPDYLTGADGRPVPNLAGERTRQQVTLSLVEYIEDVQLAQRSAANRRRDAAARTTTKRGASTKRVVTKRGGAKKAASKDAGTAPWGEGEDLLTIAARELGDASRWPEIAQLNGLRDPRAISTGQVLRLP